jgi:hypothetical protein
VVYELERALKEAAGPNLRRRPGMSGGTEENHEKPQYSRSAGRDFNTKPPEYEAGVLTNRPRRSVLYGC